MQNALVRLCAVTEHKRLAEGIHKITVAAPDMAALCRPGQFLHIRCGSQFALRRPISIFEAGDGCVSFIFDVRGAGTAVLAEVSESGVLDIMGPLGRGFTIGDTSKKAVIVGGGIGVYPLYSLAKAYGKNATVLLGFRDASRITLREEFLATGCDLHIATDDGSFGHRCLVTELLPDACDGADRIYACGPKPMLRCCAQYALEHGIGGEVSMEERMACGVGACLVCACAVKKEGGTDYAHVCKDGPVFDIERVVFDE